MLRLPKRPTRPPNARGDAVHASLERELWEHIPEYASAVHDAHRSWLFAAHVLVPLLGEHTAAAGTLVSLPAGFVQALAGEASDGVVVDADEQGRCVGVLLPDHTHFPVRAPSGSTPVVTVELKPKCGFLPQLPSPQRCTKRSVTRFAMHQRLKLKDGQVLKARACGASVLGARAHALLVLQESRYCPLDIFSHEPGRMHTALRALLDAPQNNLTVRCDGKLVFGGAGRFGNAPLVRGWLISVGKHTSSYALPGRCAL